MNQLSVGWSNTVLPNIHPVEMSRWLPREIARPAFQNSVIDGYTYDNRSPVAG